MSISMPSVPGDNVPPRALPGGTVTFLFTDLESSTQLLQRLGDRYGEVLAAHRRLLRAALQEHHGTEVDTQGDAFFIAFPRAVDAVAAAVGAQRAHAAYTWPDGQAVRVRMGLHTGEPVISAEGYVGLDVHHAARIMEAGSGGQVLLSQTTADLVQSDLPEGVSLQNLGEHRLKDLSPERIFQLVIADLPWEFPPLKSLDAVPNNLPQSLTSFVGREREREQVKRLLSTSRLVTLTGLGGSGKTRLALQVAAELAGSYRDGIWLVELATVSDPNLVPPKIAAALGLHEETGRPLVRTLADHLKPLTLLLVLDDCTQLLLACAQMSEDLLHACPNLRILATSGEALGIAGEAAWQVPSLSVPDLKHLPPGDDLASSLLNYDAVRLFVDRAALVQPNFKLTGDNALAVAQVCQRLDGIPLAIELAAARVKVLSVEQIAARLDDRFRLLTGGSRTAVPRHQTLRAAIDWSYALLSEKERVLLRRLAIFADSFTLEAAEEVCADEPESVPDGVSSADVLDLLSRLVDKSLVAVEDRGTEVRYELLQTIRQYGRDKLTESGEFAARRRRNLDFFLRLAERAEPELQGPDQKTWLDRLETEHDNFRAALTSPTAEESLSVLRLAGALWWFWYVRGYWTEGREQLERALAAGGQAPGPVRAKAMLGAGVLAWRQGDAARTQVLSQESLAMSQQLGDRRGAAYAMLGLGLSAQSQGEYQHAAELLVGSLDAFRAVGDKWGTALTTFAVGDIAAFQGDYARAAALKKESLALFQELGDRVGIAYSLRTLGIVTQYQGDYTRAWQLLDQSAGLFRELGDQGDTAYVLHDLGQVAQLQGDYARAVSLHQESLALNQKLGNKGGTALALYDLATAAEAQGDAARALNLFRRSLALRRDLGDRLGIVECLERLAGAAALQPGAQTAARAARWFGAAAALREATGASMSPGERADYERRVHAARDALGEPAFDAAWQAGRALSQEEAVGEASAPDDAK